MSDILTRLTLGTYRRVGRFLYPFMGPFLHIRARKGKEDRRRRYERYGYPSADKPEGPLVWFHAASVGESMAVLPLLERVHEQGIHTVMTTGTVTSAEVVRKRLPKATFHQYVPLDLEQAVSRFLDHWQPDLAVFTESEIWPTTIEQLKLRRIPQVLVNARMSDRSYKRWSNASRLAESLFDRFAHVVAQSETDAERFRKLGARPVTVSGNLKVDTPSLPVNGNELARLKSQIGNRPVWVAASTHKGEEEIITQIHISLLRELPGLLTIIVPRHPDRGDEVEALIHEHGMQIARRSRRENIRNVTNIYLGDTIGEMGLYLRLASVCFMGRSMAAEGGQNPLEPAMTGTAILSGDRISNFRDTYELLVKKNGARLVPDAEQLAASVNFLLQNPEKRQHMIANAGEALAEMSGALTRTVEVLDSYIFPLTVKRKLEEISDGGQ